MNVSRREMLMAGASALPLTGLWAVGAQAQTVPATAAGPAVPDDVLLAAKLLLVGRKQIEGCQFALTRAQDSAVKAFAQAEIQEHQTIQTRLQQQGLRYPVAAAAELTTAPATVNVSTPSVPTAPGAPFPPAAPVPPSGPTGRPPVSPESAGNRPVVPPPNTTLPEGRPRAVPNDVAVVPARPWVIGTVTLPVPVSRLVQIEADVAQQCIANQQRVLGALQGLRFDKAFVGQQLHAHYDFLDQAQVYRRYASAHLRPVLDEGLPIIERHITTLWQLMDRLDAVR